MTDKPDRKIEIIAKSDPNESPLRSMMAEAKGEAYQAFKTLDAARIAPDTAVVIEGDYGGTIYLTVPVKRVACSQATLQQLARDIDAMCWAQPDMVSVFFELLPVGSGVAGGMKGGLVTDGVWLHSSVEEFGVRREVEEVIAGTRARIETAGKKWR